MRKLGTLLALLLATTPLSAGAESNYYWGVMVGNNIYDDSSETFYMTALSGRLGYDLSRFIGFEGRVLASGTTTEGTVKDLGIDYMANAFAKFSWPFGKEDQVKLYALAGYTATKISYTQSSQDLYFTSNGPSYGIGIELYADHLNGLNFEWTRFLDETEQGVSFTLDQFGIGYVRRF